MFSVFIDIQSKKYILLLYLCFGVFGINKKKIKIDLFFREFSEIFRSVKRLTFRIYLFFVKRNVIVIVIVITQIIALFLRK